MSGAPEHFNRQDIAPANRWPVVARNWRTMPFMRWRAGVPAPEKLVIVPPVFSAGDANKAKEIYAGRFELAGERVDVSGISPFSVKPPSHQWADSLNGFSWLSHLTTAGTQLTQSTIQVLVSDWIAISGHRQTGPAWKIPVVAERVISWLGHAPVIIENTDDSFYRSFLASIADQTRFLTLSGKTATEGIPQLKATVAVALSSLCLCGASQAAQDKHIVQASKVLERELKVQFFADGGHISRNPDAGLEALTCLLPLYQSYLQLSKEPPAGLLSVIDRAIPMIRFFIHRDGSTGHFNGAGWLNNQLRDTVLEFGESSSAAPNNAAHCGYQRLTAGSTTIIADTGKAHSTGLSHQTHAGCLSFEMSSGSSQIVVNCGVANPRDRYLHLLARSTAAHSTATVNDTSSCRFGKQNLAGHFSDTAIIENINNVLVERSEDEYGEQICASHNGYRKAFGLIHERRVFLAANGSTINGSDRFFAATEDQAITGNRLTIRFHLHPDVTPQPLDDGISIMLNTDRGEIWKFACIDAKMEIDGSIYFAGANIPTLQIVLNAHLFEDQEIRWVFEHVLGKKDQDRGSKEQPSRQKPDDLLDMPVRNKHGQGGVV